jgi:ferritin-like metal-binding protein YciE
MAREQLIAWLNDAYAMEQELIPVLEHHASDADRDMPAAAGRLRQHVRETRRHAERIAECLRHLGSSPIGEGSTLRSVTGRLQRVTTGMFADQPVKNTLSDVTAEQFEVACYRAIAAVAMELNEPMVARLCSENLREDAEMAHWLEHQLPTVVRRTLVRSVAAAQ